MALAVALAQMRAAVHETAKAPASPTIMTHHFPVQPDRRDVSAPTTQPAEDTGLAEPSMPATLPVDQPAPSAPPDADIP
ncbi:MAG: hypothetical protein WD042_19115 [Phycisphaeraceae bacterium]